MKLKGSITISYPSNGTVRFQVRDETSRQTFLEIELSYEEFAKSLSSLAERPMTFNIHDSERIGKVKHTEDIEVEVPNNHDRDISRKHVQKFVSKKIKETGKPWIADLALSSQNSFFHKDERKFARTTMSYWE